MKKGVAGKASMKKGVAVKASRAKRKGVVEMTVTEHH